MDRMGHSTTRAALVYLHPREGRHRAIASALSDLVRTTRPGPPARPDEDGSAGVLVPA
jgi:hypothetical protein